MKIDNYRIRVKHDNGFTNFRVAATSEQQARSQVCEAEGCPDHAITKVKLISKK